MAKQKLSDYAHLYVGCRCTIVDAKGKPTGSYLDFNPDRLKRLLHEQQKYKLFLRSLDDMTQQEAEEIYRALDVSYQFRVGNPIYLFQSETHGSHLDRVQWAIAIKMMLAKSFDLFNLIENKLAIEYKKSKD